MLTGAAPEVGQGFCTGTRLPWGRVALAGFAVVLAVAACHPSRSVTPPAADAAAAPAEAAAAPAPPRGKQIAIAYSSNILGEYEPCG